MKKKIKDLTPEDCKKLSEECKKRKSCKGCRFEDINIMCPFIHNGGIEFLSDKGLNQEIEVESNEIHKN